MSLVIPIGDWVNLSGWGGGGGPLKFRGWGALKKESSQILDLQGLASLR